jgi:CheY-like chemotaxis protein
MTHGVVTPARRARWAALSPAASSRFAACATAITSGREASRTSTSASVAKRVSGQAHEEYFVVPSRGMEEQLFALVVDDDPDVRQSLRELLLAADYRVSTVENGEKALYLLQTEEELPSVILLDLLMPIMNGWQFRRAQIKDARLASIPVVVLTGGSFPDEAVESIRASAWLAKPLDHAQLVETLARVARGRPV